MARKVLPSCYGIEEAFIQKQTNLLRLKKKKEKKEKKKKKKIISHTWRRKGSQVDQEQQTVFSNSGEQTPYANLTKKGKVKVIPVFTVA